MGIQLCTMWGNRFVHSHFGQHYKMVVHHIGDKWTNSNRAQSPTLCLSLCLSVSLPICVSPPVSLSLSFSLSVQLSSSVSLSLPPSLSVSSSPSLPLSLFPSFPSLSLPSQSLLYYPPQQEALPLWSCKQINVITIASHLNQWTPPTSTDVPQITWAALSFIFIKINKLLYGAEVNDCITANPGNQCVMNMQHLRQGEEKSYHACREYPSGFDALTVALQAYWTKTICDVLSQRGWTEDERIETVFVLCCGRLLGL